MASSSLRAKTRRRSFADWLLALDADVPPAIRASLLQSLYGTLPIYIGGVVNTLTVAAALAIRIGTPLLYAWVVFELLVAAARLYVLLACRRAVREGREGPAQAYLSLSLLWAAGIGFGSFAAVTSGDWIAALVACVSSAAMLGGICFRYYAAPRLVCGMLLAVGVPGALACIVSGEPLLMLAGLQIPIYIFAMTNAAWRMNRMMVAALCAERDEAHRARHDALTGLLNRTGLSEAFDARPKDEPLACFFMDLDGFKRVNDTLGHAAGDRLLEMVADRLRGFAPERAILARLGGDEFVAILPCAEPIEADALGERLAEAAAGLPYIIEAQGVLIGASVGGALRAEHGPGLETLVAAADEALYRAKAHGHVRCMIAEPGGQEGDAPRARAGLAAAA